MLIKNTEIVSIKTPVTLKESLTKTSYNFGDIKTINNKKEVQEFIKNNSGYKSQYFDKYGNSYKIEEIEIINKMSNSEAIINFMFFANNFSSNMIENCFEVCSNSLHLKNKYNSLRSKDITGTDMFLKWFMLLGNDNKKNVSNFINNSYKK